MKQRRNTIAKTEILSLITKSDVALSHAEIQLCLNNLCDRVTTYRVLERLISEGLIHKIVSIEGGVKYALCHHCDSTKHHHNHIHFSCVRCRTISCLEEVEPQFSLPPGYMIAELNFTVSGLCPECAKQNESFNAQL